MLFQPLLSQTPGVISSPVVTVTTDLSLSVDAFGGSLTHFIVNGLEQGTEVSLQTGDTVQLVSTVDTENSTAIFSLTSNGVTEFTYFTTVSSEYPYKFKFIDSLPQLPGPYTSSSFQLYRIKNPIVVRVPDVASSSIIKNGVPQGQECICDNGDTISVSLIIPDTPSWSISVPVSVGNYIDSLDVWRAYQDQVVDDISFIPQTGVLPGSICQSNTVTLTGIDTPITARTSAKLFLNGVETPTPCLVSNGDTLYLEQISSSNYGSAQHSLLWLGERVFDFVSLTQASQLYVKDSYLGKDLFDIKFSPDNSNNRVISFNTSEVISTLPINTQASGSISDNQLIVASYWEDCLYILDPVSGLQKSVSLPQGSHPCSVSTIPLTPDPGGPHVHFVTLSGSNSIVELDVETYEPKFYTYLGDKFSPKGLDSNNDAYLYIATTGGTLRFDYLFKTLDILDSTPSTEVCSFGDRIFVSCLSSNQVKEFQGTELIRSFSSGLNPYGLTTLNQSLFICNSADNSLACFDLVQNKITKTFATNSYPVFCSTLENNIIIAHHGSKDLLVLNPNTGDQTQIDLNGFPYGLSSSFACLLYDNTPLRVAELSVTPSGSQILYDVEANTSTLFNLSANATRSISITIPELDGVKLLIDGVDVGSTWYLIPGQSFQVSTTTGSNYSTTYTTLVTIGASIIPLTTVTSFDNIPDFMEFGGIYNLFRRSFIASTSKQISGIDTDKVASITYDNPDDSATIIVNGVSKGKSAVVSLGDTIELSSRVMGICGETIKYSLTSRGHIVGNFELGTYVVEGPVKDLTNPEVSTDSLDGQYIKTDLLKPCEVIDTKETTRILLPQLFGRTPEPLLTSKVSLKASLPHQVIDKHVSASGNLPRATPNIVSTLSFGGAPKPLWVAETKLGFGSLPTSSTFKSLPASGELPSPQVQPHTTSSFSTSGDYLEQSNTPYLTDLRSSFEALVLGSSYFAPGIITRETPLLAKIADPRPLTPTFQRVSTGTFSTYALTDKFEKVKVKSWDPFQFISNTPQYRLSGTSFIKFFKTSFKGFVFNYNRGVKASDHAISREFNRGIISGEKSFKRTFTSSAFSQYFFEPSSSLMRLSQGVFFTQDWSKGLRMPQAYFTGSYSKNSRNSFLKEGITTSKSELVSQHYFTAHFTRFEEPNTFDTGLKRGLYSTEQEAFEASGNDPHATLYTFEGRYTYKTAPDSSIVCKVPLTKVIKIAGWIHGG